MCVTIVFCNQKGGACKTTTTAAFAAYLTRAGKKVLCVDTDQQGSLSFLFGADLTSPGAFEVFTAKSKDPDITPCIQHLDTCDLISADDRLVAAEVSLMQEISRELKLKRALKFVKNKYDYILIDTPPALSVLMLNALSAADWAVIPTNASVLHARGMLTLCQTIESVQESCNPRLKIAGVVITMYRHVIAQKAMEDVLKQILSNVDIDAPIFEQKIRQSTYVEDAQRMGADLFSHRKHLSSAVVMDYQSLVNECLLRIF